MTESPVASLFLVRPRPRHWERFRGQGRYYRKVLRAARAFAPDLSDGGWFDYWHYHADWPGYGDYGWRHRRSHLMAHCAVFATLAGQVDGYSQPYQLWLYLDRGDAGQDAVYFHTPNPNGDHFPAKPTGVRWGQPALERYLEQFLSLPLRAGVTEPTDTQAGSYFIYSPLYGESLE